MTRRLTYGEECCLRHWSRAETCTIPGELLRLALAELEEMRRSFDGALVACGKSQDMRADMEKLRAELEKTRAELEAERQEVELKQLCINGMRKQHEALMAAERPGVPASRRGRAAHAWQAMQCWLLMCCLLHESKVGFVLKYRKLYPLLWGSKNP